MRECDQLGLFMMDGLAFGTFGAAARIAVMFCRVASALLAAPGRHGGRHGHRLRLPGWYLVTFRY